MRRTRRGLDSQEHRSICNIHIGDIFAGLQPTVVCTTLGSCIAVCLRDPLLQIGGMNHFMLPTGGQDETASARYGVHAMELLINACMRWGADRQRLEAKVFGGAHVLQVRESANSVPQCNIRFALKFLEAEQIPIISRDLGGYAAREVLFFTDTGRTLLRRLQRTGRANDRMLAALEQEEFSRGVVSPPSDDSNIVLF